MSLKANFSSTLDKFKEFIIYSCIFLFLHHHMENTAQDHRCYLCLPHRCGAAAPTGIERGAESRNDIVDGVRRSVGNVDDDLPELVEGKLAVAVLVQRPHDGRG